MAALGDDVEGAFQVNLGRVLIAAFMVAIFLGPRRWMAWAAGARDRVALIRARLARPARAPRLASGARSRQARG